MLFRSAIIANQSNWAIVTTEKALQFHLPPPEVLQSYCLNLQSGIVREAREIDETLARLGYERVPLVETEGQWSRRGDIVDIFPVSAELPIRLEWFGDELERLREFDPATQRSLDKIEQLTLTPTSFSSIIFQAIQTLDVNLSDYLNEAAETANYPQGMQRFLGIAFTQPASLLD